MEHLVDVDIQDCLNEVPRAPTQWLNIYKVIYRDILKTIFFRNATPSGTIFSTEHPFGWRL